MGIFTLAALLFLFIIVSCVLAIVAFLRTSALKYQITYLRNELSLLNKAALAPAPPVAEVKKQKAEPIRQPDVRKFELEKPIIAAAVPEIKIGEAKPTRDVEQALASRWFVWIGGAAVALAGLLLIKYAHDQGLIPPVLRVLFGLAFAAALVKSGEYVRNARPKDVLDYVPAALSAAGLITAFGSIYAAHAFYNLIPGAIAFIGLGLVALGAFYLSRLQGPSIASLGLLGAYVAPMLITSHNPNAWSFFPYILVIVVASFYTMRQPKWWWLGYAAIAGATIWSLLWIHGGAFEPSDVLPIGIFAMCLAAATLLVDAEYILSALSGNLADPKNMSQPLRLAFCGMAAGSAILATQVLQSAHGFVALLLFAIGMAPICAFSWRKQGWSGAALAAAALSFCVLMAWQEVSIQNWAMDESGMWSTVPGTIAPPLFRNWMFLALAGFSAVGALGYLRKPLPQAWAFLCASSAFAFLFGTWARADFVMAQSVWATFALALAVSIFALAYIRRAKLPDSNFDTATSALLVGAAGLALFGFDRLFDDVWFTLIIAALAAWFASTVRFLPTRVTGAIASALGTLAAAQLFISREFWGQVTVLPLGAHWPIYGYGVTVALLWWASRQLSNDKYKRHAIALEGLSLGLVISLVSLELRTLIAAGSELDHTSLLEVSAHILAWLGAAYGLIYRQQFYSTFVSVWGSRILLAASCAAIVFISLLAKNPLVSGDRIEGGVLINTLWLAYLAPVGLLALIARKMENLGWQKWRNALGLLSLVLVVAFVTLQTKRVFQGQYLIPEFSSDAESYAISAMWLLTAVAIFIAGLKLNRQTIRYGGMAVMVLALLKTFAYDLWQLGGLWQIASVMGIGLSLIGVGWLYTRFVKQGLA
jgi:uncharacterized membrane protein